MNVHQICAPSALPASSCRTGSAQLVPPTAQSATPLLNVWNVPKDTTWPSTEAALPARVHAPAVFTSMSAKVAPMGHTSTP